VSRPINAHAYPVQPPEKPPEKPANEPVRLSDVERDVMKAFTLVEAFDLYPHADGKTRQAKDRAARFFRLVKREHRQAERDRAALQRARDVMKLIVAADQIDQPRDGLAADMIRNAARRARVELGLSLNDKTAESDATPPSAQATATPGPAYSDMNESRYQATTNRPDLFAPTPG